MPQIKQLPKNVAELIAAGEVVERPASVIKELVENSIDAGATAITVEIKRGGITYIRVTDNGCGIPFDEVPTAFLRHATSKIRTDEDLNSIATLGFRGEALAAVSAVARVEMLTATENAASGTLYKIEGGEEAEHSEVGCPKGTTIIIRDIFYNTPARMKFLKKDVSEANACAAVIDRIALSHPEISFKLIRDGKQTLSTAGDGNIKSAVYSVLGRELSATLIEAEREVGGIKVSGLVCKPVSCKPTRNYQFTFLNGRLVRSGTVIAATEQAYKNSVMVGKFPAFLLFLTVPFETVDVNVHPAKTEVRFSDEKRIFDAVYTTVRAALTSGDTRPEIKPSMPVFNKFEHMTAKEYRQQVIGEETVAEKVYKEGLKPIAQKQAAEKSAHKPTSNCALSFNNTPSAPDFLNKYSLVDEKGGKTEPVVVSKATEERGAPAVIYAPKAAVDVDIEVEKAPKEKPKTEEKSSAVSEFEKAKIRVIGEAFSTYIIAEMGDSVFMIDKHAAHERILFNRLKENGEIEIQPLLLSATVNLPKNEYDAVISNLELLEKHGFEIDDFGSGSVVVRAVPAMLKDEDVPALIGEVAESLSAKGIVENGRIDDILHTVACRAAIKAGNITSITEMQDLAEKILSNNKIMYCPHGRPVAFEIKKRELEKQFGRIQ